MKSIDHRGLRTWIEVDTKAIAHNYRAFRALIPRTTKLMAVVKSNAYGHDLVQFATEVIRLGADMIGVDSIVEAVTLREHGVRAPILVLGYTLPERLADAVTHDVIVSVGSFETFSAAEQVSRKTPLRLHLKIDTGMHRQGFMLSEMKQLITTIQKTSCKIEGVFTHFGAAKNPAFPDDTREQLRQFLQWREAFTAAGIHALYHAAATGGALVFPESHLDMVRIGIGLYGLPPSREADVLAHAKGVVRKPVLAWRSVVASVKQVVAGERVGYDFTERLSRESVLAVVPVGYWHGLPRALSSIGEVLIKGKRARIVGRISMDMITVDVTHIPNIKEGAVVTLVGTDGESEISAPEISMLCDGSWYELVTTLNPLIKRIYT